MKVEEVDGLLWLVGGGTIHLSTLLMVRARIVGDDGIRP